MKHREPKTPWNPSRSATERVLNPIQAPVVCRYCNGPVSIVHHKDVYGRAYSEWPWMYRCNPCDASVGMHPFTAIPLGTLANRELRNVRKQCKLPFDRLWRLELMSRDEAYARLAQHLGIDVAGCHFGWFEAEMCHAAAQWAVQQGRSQ